MATVRSTTCAECKTINEPGTVWCDCGWSLDGSGEHNRPGPLQPKRERSTGEQILRGAVVFFALAPLRLVASIGADSSVPGVLVWAFAIGLTGAFVYLWHRYVWRE